tara:strand:- start:781 stop:981 length:201 start_codon:yes stop_codon:yes gene_type:complete
MDLQTALTRYTNVHQELKPVTPNHTETVLALIKKSRAPIKMGKRTAAVSEEAILNCSRGYDFQYGI